MNSKQNTQPTGLHLVTDQAASVGPEDDATMARLSFGGGSDASLAESALAVRNGLVARYGAETITKKLLVDGAASSYYLQQKLARWTATITNSIDRDIFSGGTFPAERLAGNETAWALERVGRQLELQERATRQLDRYLKMLQDEAAGSSDVAPSRKQPRRRI
jgi:hypothetical protein